MPIIPWLSTLPKGARLFYPIAMKGVSQGISANSILRAYSAARPGLRRTVGLEVIRRIKGVEKAASAFKSLKRTVMPSVAKMPTALTRMARDYSYLTEFQAVTSTGKTVTGNITVSSWNVITRDQAEGAALGYLDNMPENYGIESVEKIQLVGIKKSPIIGQR